MPRNMRKTGILGVYEIILWIAIIGLLYITSISNYLLFHALAELFSIYVTYVAFLIVWKSRLRLENRTLIFIGTAYFFVASLDLLHTFAYKGMGIFPQFGANLPTQLWITARYVESISLLIAPMLLIDTHTENSRKYINPEEKEELFWLAFAIYAGIMAVCLLSIFVFRNFPDSYIEGSGLTPFKIISEYIISFILICSLVVLYTKKDIFEKRIFNLIAASIIVTIFGELAFTLYVDVYGFFNLMGHYFKILSFYLIYKAIIETGFDDPYTLLFRELKQSEEAFRQEASFLRDDQGRIYSMLGVKKNEPENQPAVAGLQINEKNRYPLLEDIHGFIGYRLDEDFVPVFMEGAIEEITGYTKEDFLTHKVKWLDIVTPEDQSLTVGNFKKSISNPQTSTELEYRIQSKDGEIKWVREVTQRVPAGSGTPGEIHGVIRDITERKMVEETLEKIDKARIKEIHHRIKNNLQVISSLLSLEAERFSDAKMLEAFRESQNRVTSMAIIHEELYKGDEIDTLDFSEYLRKLIADLFRSYSLANRQISLKLELERIYLGMDTAIPLGIIVNELVSNALKHAFPTGKRGEIGIILSKAEDYEKLYKGPEESGSKPGCLSEKELQFVLVIEDNGRGFPVEIDFKNTNSLGLELVNILVEQIEGCLVLERSERTRFIIWFSNQG